MIFFKVALARFFVLLSEILQLVWQFLQNRYWDFNTTLLSLYIIWEYDSLVSFLNLEQSVTIVDGLLHQLEKFRGITKSAQQLYTLRWEKWERMDRCFSLPFSLHNASWLLMQTFQILLWILQPSVANPQTCVDTAVNSSMLTPSAYFLIQRLTISS